MCHLPRRLPIHKWTLKTCSSKYQNEKKKEGVRGQGGTKKAGPDVTYVFKNKKVLSKEIERGFGVLAQHYFLKTSHYWLKENIEFRNIREFKWVDRLLHNEIINFLSRSLFLNFEFHLIFFICNAKKNKIVLISYNFIYKIYKWLYQQMKFSFFFYFSDISIYRFLICK